jgi:hypothetical protein
MSNYENFFSKMFFLLVENKLYYWLAIKHTTSLSLCHKFKQKLANYFQISFNAGFETTGYKNIYSLTLAFTEVIT